MLKLERGYKRGLRKGEVRKHMRQERGAAGSERCPFRGQGKGGGVSTNPVLEGATRELQYIFSRKHLSPLLHLSQVRKESALHLTELSSIPKQKLASTTY